MNHSRFAMVLLLLLFAHLPLEAQRPARSTLQVDSLKDEISSQAANDDLDTLRSILVEMHPGLHLYASQKEIDALVQASRVKQGETVPLRQFYMNSARIADLIRCGHTYTNVPANCQFKLEYATKMFPLPLMFIEKRAYVNHHKVAIPCGAEILSINGRAIDEISKELMPLITGDGYVNTYRYRFLGELFAVSFATAYGETKEFVVNFKTAAGDLKRKRISAVPSHVLVERMDSVALGRLKTNAYRVSRPRKDTVLLAIDTFDNGNGAPSFRVYRRLVEKSFEMMHDSDSVKNLILDLRQNDGGYTRCEMLLYSYLANKPFKEMDSGQTTRNTIAFRELLSRDYQSRGTARYYDRMLQREVVDGSGDQWELQDEWIVQGIPAEHRFRGKVYVLTGGRTHSAAAAICTRLKEQGGAVFVGEETGGVEGVFTAGTTLIYELPNTGVELAVPIYRYNNLSKMPAEQGRGIIPDHQVKIQPEDLVSGQDRVLEFALDLINQAVRK